MKHISILTYRLKNTSQVHTIRFFPIFEWGGAIHDLSTQLEDKHGKSIPAPFFDQCDYAVISKEIAS